MSSKVDIVVYGASGYTGRKVCCYLREGTNNAHSWAIAGRDRAKLEALAKELNLSVPVFVGDVADPASLDAVCGKAKVLISCAGPFEKVGEPVVAACLRNGVHYVDTTGEFQFVRRIIEQHHDEAVQRGVCIVPCCGFDSIPSDLGNYMVHKALGGPSVQSVQGYYKLGRFGASSGTVHSILNLAETISRKDLGPCSLNPPDGVKPYGCPTRKGIWYENGRFTAPFLMASVNERVVRRTNALLGLRSSYVEAMEGSLLTTVASTVVSFALVACVAVPFFRKWVKGRWPAGYGPSDEQKAKGGKFQCTFVGRAANDATCTVVISDERDAYTVTGVFVSECAKAALTCASAKQLMGGVRTPMSAFGDVLVKNIRDAGVCITTTMMISGTQSSAAASKKSD